MLEESEPQLWQRIQSRIDESLPDYQLGAVERVQNRSLWRKYCAFRTEFAEQHGSEVLDERELFHYASMETVDRIVESVTVGFDPRLGGGEYGRGTYFAQHAIYSAAYGAYTILALSLLWGIDRPNHCSFVWAAGGDWLAGGVECERAAPEQITLLWAKVCLGFCKDFGPRCTTERGDVFADELGFARSLEGDWGPRIGRHGLAGRNRGPPRDGDNLFDSVTGTEGALIW